MTADRSSGVVFWRPDPNAKRLSMQRSWDRLLRELSLTQKVSVEVKYSAITRGYHCQVFRLDERRDYARIFLAEGNGSHPIGSLRDALSVISPLAPTVRSALVEALIDYLREEIEKNGLLSATR